ncbi:hypothetical protein [Hydrocarboniphaga sp.]
MRDATWRLRAAQQSDREFLFDPHRTTMKGVVTFEQDPPFVLMRR